MSRDLHSELTKIAPAPSGRPDIESIRRRGIRRRYALRAGAASFAVSLVGASFFLVDVDLGRSDLSDGPAPPSPSASVQNTPSERELRDYAAVVALKAMSDAGLFGKAGPIHFPYDLTLRIGDRRWRAEFCRYESCSKVEADAFVEVIADRNATHMEVVAASGTIPSDKRDELIGYRVPVEKDTDHPTFGRIWVGRNWLRTSIFWVGAIPSQVYGTCYFEVFDGGKLVASRSLSGLGVERESDRAGVAVMGFNKRIAGLDVRPRCEGYE